MAEKQMARLAEHAFVLGEILATPAHYAVAVALVACPRRAA
jgi:hypothetical protein